jgi:hypothetical protein
LYSIPYYYFSLGHDISVVLTSRPFLLSGYNSIFQANTLLLYSVLYYYPFSSGYDPLVILASYPFSRVASVFLLLVINLFLQATPYYNLVFQLLLAAIIILAVRTYPTSTKRLK